MFYVGLTLGTLTAGLIQSAASKNLDGSNGLAGWRWMFIITSVITLPLGLVGFFIWPGTPGKPSRRFLSQKELELAKTRLKRSGVQSNANEFNWKLIGRIFSDWKIYVLTIWDMFFWNGCINSSSGGYLLWLKSLNRYSTSKLNNLSTISPALGIFYVLFICFGSDLFLGRAGAITVAHVINIIGLIILTVWNVPEAAKWFAFNTTYFSVAMSSVLYGWANDILKHDVEERAITLIIMNAIAQSTTAWTPLLVFKTAEAPRFRKGYPFVAANAGCLIIMTWIVRYLHKKQE